jgi:hypothetical protein
MPPTRSSSGTGWPSHRCAGEASAMSPRFRPVRGAGLVRLGQLLALRENPLPIPRAERVHHRVEPSSTRRPADAVLARARTTRRLDRMPASTADGRSPPPWPPHRASHRHSLIAGPTAGQAPAIRDDQGRRTTPAPAPRAGRQDRGRHHDPKTARTAAMLDRTTPSPASTAGRSVGFTPQVNISKS